MLFLYIRSLFRSLIFVGLRVLTKIFCISWKLSYFQLYPGRIWNLCPWPKRMCFCHSLYKSSCNEKILRLVTWLLLKLSLLRPKSLIVFLFRLLFHSNLLSFLFELLVLYSQRITISYAKASKSPIGKASILLYAWYKFLGKFETYKEYSFSFLTVSIHQFFQLWWSLSIFVRILPKSHQNSGKTHWWNHKPAQSKHRQSPITTNRSYLQSKSVFMTWFDWWNHCSSHNDVFFLCYLELPMLP